jgi:uncharacterized protein YndB with AHSA1/START domain
MSSPSTTGFKLSVTRVIAAPCAMAFRAWTEPKQMAQWFCPKDVRLEGLTADVKVGGAFRIHMVSDKGDHIAIGNYRAIEPNKRLQFTWQWQTYAMPDSIVTVEFEDLGTKTRVTLVHEGLPDQEDKDQHTHGWTSLLEKFAELIEQNKIK